MVSGNRSNTPVTQCEDLPERDREILRLLTQGNTNQEIAREVGLSPSTISNMLRSDHASSIFQKIGVDNRAAAIVWYTRHCNPPQAVSSLPVFAAILTTVYVCVIIFLFLPLNLYADVTSLPYIYSDLNAVVPAVAGIYGLVRVRRMAGNTNLYKKVTWWLSLALLLWAVGQGLWIIWIFVYRQLVPYPSPADIGYFLCAVFFVRGAYLLQKGLLTDSSQQRFIKWFISFVLIALTVAFTFWARNGRIDLKGDPLKLFLDICYASLDAIGVGMLVYIIRSAMFRNIGVQTQRMVYAIAIGTVILYLADASFAATTSLPTDHPWAYYNGSWPDRIFTTAFWIIGVGITFIPQWYRSRTAQT